MIKVVVFDMAGTTVDEDNVVYKTVLQAINEQGYDFTLEDVLAEGAGKEKLQAIKSVLAIRGIQDNEMAQQMFSRFSSALTAAYQTFPITEQPHATQVFHELKHRGIAVVLNTGYSRAVAEALVEKIGWKLGTDIDILVTASDVPENRPNPDMILYAMKALGVTDAKQVVKVGDSAIDIEEGRNAGCGINIGITTGAQTPVQLEKAHPEFLVDDLKELLPIIDKANSL
jgi:phosphonatase-like hydrolase